MRQKNAIQGSNASFDLTKVNLIFNSSMRLTRSRLSTLHDFEYAIKWECIRTEYFRAHGRIQLADQSTKNLKDLQWRYAIEAQKNEAPSEESLTHSGWDLASQSLTNSGWSTATEASVFT